MCWRTLSFCLLHPHIPAAVSCCVVAVCHFLLPQLHSLPFPFLHQAFSPHSSSLFSSCTPGGTKQLHLRSFKDYVKQWNRLWLVADPGSGDITGNHTGILRLVNTDQSGVSLLSYWQRLQGVQMVLEKSLWSRDVKTIDFKLLETVNRCLCTLKFSWTCEPLIGRMWPQCAVVQGGFMKSHLF